MCTDVYNVNNKANYNYLFILNSLHTSTKKIKHHYISSINYKASEYAIINNDYYKSLNTSSNLMQLTTLPFACGYNN